MPRCALLISEPSLKVALIFDHGSLDEDQSAGARAPLGIPASKLNL
jgi:hypothetical protein